MAKKKSEEHNSDGGDDQDFEEEPNFEDPEGFVDDASDEGSNRMFPVILNILTSSIFLTSIFIVLFVLFFRGTR